MNPPSAPSAPWAAVLDELATQVEASWALLRDGADPGGVELAPWDPPAGLGTCPDALRPRALEVLRAQAELEEGLARRMATVAREVQTASRRGHAQGHAATAPRNRFLDQRA